MIGYIDHTHRHGGKISATIRRMAGSDSNGKIAPASMPRTWDTAHVCGSASPESMESTEPWA